ncbi:MAG: PEP-CTERM sorting domain-containing protein [Armatimonadota bacterium]|nr:PEP-CTERM sorting domain-containing protein [Armatimonadota bacterium]
MKQITIISLGLCVSTSQAQTFASSVVEAHGLGGDPFYNDPNAMLGRPTLWNRDEFGGGPKQRVATSIAYGPWQLDDQGNNVVTSIPVGGHVIVSFDEPILDDPSNWYGLDFTVYGNASFLSDGYVEWNTNLETLTITGPDVFAEPTEVSISPDLVNWYTYPSSFADDLFPTQAFNWDFDIHNWGADADWTKPVNPSLSGENFDGLSVAHGIELYEGSAGGTSFDLAESGFTSVRYIRFNGSGGEIDGVARVGHAVPEPASVGALSVLLLFLLRRKK